MQKKPIDWLGWPFWIVLCALVVGVWRWEDTLLSMTRGIGMSDTVATIIMVPVFLYVLFSILGLGVMFEETLGKVRDAWNNSRRRTK